MNIEIKLKKGYKPTFPQCCIGCLSPTIILKPILIAGQEKINKSELAYSLVLNSHYENNKANQYKEIPICNFCNSAFNKKEKISYFLKVTLSIVGSVVALVIFRPSTYFWFIGASLVGSLGGYFIALIYDEINPPLFSMYAQKKNIIYSFSNKEYAKRFQEENSQQGEA